MQAYHSLLFSLSGHHHDDAEGIKQHCSYPAIPPGFWSTPGTWYNCNNYDGRSSCDNDTTAAPGFWGDIDGGLYGAETQK
eukprot:12428954-Karenia_brevis.AAC.1